MRETQTRQSRKWYEHFSEGVVETGEVNILWNMNIQCYHVIKPRVPDMILLNKVGRKCIIIDIAVPDDSRANNKESKKVNKYQDLNGEVNKIWSMRSVIVAFVTVRVLLSMTTKKNIGITFNAALSWKIKLLGKVRILRKVLEY